MRSYVICWVVAINMNMKGSPWIRNSVCFFSSSCKAYFSLMKLILHCWWFGGCCCSGPYYSTIGLLPKFSSTFSLSTSHTCIRTAHVHVHTPTPFLSALHHKQFMRKCVNMSAYSPTNILAFNLPPSNWKHSGRPLHRTIHHSSL